MLLRVGALVAVVCVMITEIFFVGGEIYIPSSDRYIQYEGRYSEDPSGKEFDAPGFLISTGILGVSKVEMSLVIKSIDQPNRFWVFIDGVLSDTVVDTSGMTPGTTTRLLVASNLSTSFHTVRVVKITEADWNNPYPTANSLVFEGFTLDSGTTAPVPAAPLRRIEFIGDSITAGYCNMCKDTSETAGYALESFAASWPSLVCSTFGASCHTTAWSGMGLVRNCCGGDTHLPEVFTRTLASVEQSQWAFNASSWAPDAVVINLGTNDNLDPSADPSDPLTIEAQFVQTYVSFVLNISTWYTPNPVTFFLACGPMSDAYCTYVDDVIAQLTAGAEPLSVEFLDQRGVITADNQCCGHPDRYADETLANLTVSTMAAVLHWDATKA